VTVKELIAELENFDEELPVYWEDTQWGPLPIERVILDPKADSRNHKYVRGVVFE